MKRAGMSSIICIVNKNIVSDSRRVTACRKSRQPSMYTVVAVYDVLVMRIDKDEFAEFVQNNTRNALAIIRNLSWCMVNLKGNLDLALNCCE